MRMEINDINSFIIGILSSVVGGIFLIIISFVFKLSTRLMNQTDEFDGIYEGNAEDLICDNSKPNLDMLYIIRAKIYRPLFKSDYKIEAHLDIYDRPTKDPLARSGKLKGNLRVSNNMGYMDYSLTLDKLKNMSELGSENDGLIIFSIPSAGKLYGNWITHRPVKNQKCKILFGSIYLTKVERPSRFFWLYKPEEPLGKIEKTYLLNEKDPSDSWRKISVEEYLDIKSKGGLF